MEVSLKDLQSSLLNSCGEGKWESPIIFGEVREDPMMAENIVDVLWFHSNGEVCLIISTRKGKLDKNGIQKYSGLSKLK